MARAEVWAAMVKRWGKAEARHALEERAAIREHHGGQSMADAEDGAWDDMRGDFR